MLFCGSEKVLSIFIRFFKLFSFEFAPSVSYFDEDGGVSSCENIRDDLLILLGLIIVENSAGEPMYK
jgi:hypothetical protein